MTAIRTRTKTPTQTPITIHFQSSFVFSVVAMVTDRVVMFGGAVVILDVVVGELGVVSTIADLISDIVTPSTRCSSALLFFITVSRAFTGMTPPLVRYNGSKM